jgi:NTE family protein
MKIALALSGGGFRATVFHLGVLARLAQEQRLEDVNILSTVSGGSLCVGLIHALNGLQWPTSSEYITRVLPEARRLLTTKDLQRAIIIRQVSMFWNIFETRADDLSAMMKKHWGITAKLGELPKQPRWMINATCYETGKNWRFERFRMGDYMFGYSFDPDIPLSDALAASAGFPGLIGPLVLDTRRYEWSNYLDMPQEIAPLTDPESQRSRVRETVKPDFPIVHLWDGGAYDNYGLEGLIDVRSGWRKDVEFLIVSDGAGRSNPEKYRRGPKALLRLATGIMMDQVRSLRTRVVMERLLNHFTDDKGSFLQMGNTGSYVLSEVRKESLIPQIAPGCMGDQEAQLATNMPTAIRKLTPEEFERLFRHGFEVADYTLFAYHADQFAYIGYANRPIVER